MSESTPTTDAEKDRALMRNILTKNTGRDGKINIIEVNKAISALAGAEDEGRLKRYLAAVDDILVKSSPNSGYSCKMQLGDHREKSILSVVSCEVVAPKTPAAPRDPNAYNHR